MNMGLTAKRRSRSQFVVPVILFLVLSICYVSHEQRVHDSSTSMRKFSPARRLMDTGDPRTLVKNTVDSNMVMKTPDNNEVMKTSDNNEVMKTSDTTQMIQAPVLKNPYFPLTANIPVFKKVIYTFWGPVTPLENGERGTGMTDKADEQMFSLWKQSWEAIGWEPRILTIEHAKQHPNFQEFFDKLQNVPLWGNRRKGVNREYNQWCYVRWLAMAAVGGGYMSDYDVVPVTKIPYQLGTFTTYQAGVPALVSGTQEEWSRMAWAILEDGLQHNQPDVELWSDMHAFAAIKEQAGYMTKQTVIAASRLMTGKPWTDQECKILAKHNAIHFSHNSIKAGVTREGETFKDRPRIAANIMNLYHTKCGIKESN